MDIVPDPLKDQFFLTNEEIVQKIVSFANLDKTDVVLEVGAGTGNLTKEISKYAGKVIAFEIDKRFKQFLNSLPQNVEVHYENAWDFVQLHGKFRKKKEYNKIISNPPYSFIEPLLHNLTFLIYDKVILLVPLKTLKTLQTSKIFSSFFTFKILLKVPKQSFFPVPKTNSAVIDLIKLPDPIGTKDLGLFLKQYIYQHEGQLVKNSLMEGIIKYSKLVNKKFVTKNEARKIISKTKISKELLEKLPDNPEIYDQVDKKFKTLS